MTNNPNFEPEDDRENSKINIIGSKFHPEEKKMKISLPDQTVNKGTNTAAGPQDKNIIKIKGKKMKERRGKSESVFLIVGYNKKKDSKHLGQD